MSKYYRRVSMLLVVFLVLIISCVWAAPGSSTIQKIRFSQTPEKVRVVFDMDNVPDYNVVLEQQPLRLIVEMPAGLADDNLTQMTFNDPFVSSIQSTETEPGRVRITINLKQSVNYRFFNLKSPNRLVVDLMKLYDQKTEAEIVSGVKYMSWQRSQAFGPVKAHILTVDTKKGYVIKPVLSNGAIAGLETVAAMSTQANAIAAINGSYFAPNGEIIGLLKIDGEIISTPTIPRTALGILPDGRMIFDLVGYEGSVLLPDGNAIALNGVNRTRGENELILYNEYYGPRTGTNNFGIEYVVGSDGRITLVSIGNTPIKPGTVIVSAHGDAAGALSSLKIGDSIRTSQTLGPVWDTSTHALGAGPMLVKNGSVFLTTKTEDFGSDVAGGRAPRTAIGITKDGNLLLVVVDGRQPGSVGLTLLELALLMQELGAVDAMNLDGGGSSEMTIDGNVMNKPSDGRERKVGDALVVIAPKLAN